MTYFLNDNTLEKKLIFRELISSDPQTWKVDNFVTTDVIIIKKTSSWELGGGLWILPGAGQTRGQHGLQS